jgi:hypothetical protein
MWVETKRVFRKHPFCYAVKSFDLFSEIRVNNYDSEEDSDADPPNKSVCEVPIESFSAESVELEDERALSTMEVASAFAASFS